VSLQAGPSGASWRGQFSAVYTINPDRIVGLESIVKDAVELKFTAAQRGKQQLTELIQIPPRQ